MLDRLTARNNASQFLMANYYMEGRPERRKQPGLWLSERYQRRRNDSGHTYDYHSRVWCLCTRRYVYVLACVRVYMCVTERR